MKKSTSLLLFIACFVLNSFFISAQEVYPNYQVGIQSTFPIGGLSAKVNLTETHGAQAVVTLYGPVSSVFGRYLYHFEQTESDWGVAYRPYVFGQMGYYRVKLDSYFDDSADSETTFGYGVGGGIEWGFTRSFKNIKMNLELGYNKVDLNSYTYKGMAFGVGMHYQFNL